MKIKKSLKTICLGLVASALLISCTDTKEPSSSSTPPTRAELKKAVATLKRFGDKISSGNLSKEDRQLIEELAGTPIPVSAFLQENAILVAGTNFKTKEDVVINSATGKSIDNCNRNYDSEQRNIKVKSKPKCKTQVVPPNDLIKDVLNITKPIKGEIIVDGIRKDAFITASITYSFEGSYCITRIQAGKQTETCYSY